MKMSVASIKKTTGSKSSIRRLSTKDSFQSKKSRCSGSITSEYGSKFGRSVSKFPKQNDPSLVQSVSIVNSRVIRSVINFPVKSNSKLPDLTHTEATDCIREMGNFFNILDYEFNYASFWLLDVLSKLIKHMQLRMFSDASQNTCLAWFRFVLRLISISGTPREEIFSLLQEMFLKAEEFVKTGCPIPQPEEIDDDYKKSSKLSRDLGSLLSSKSLPSIASTQSKKTHSRKSSKSPGQSSLTSNHSKRRRSSKSSSGSIGKQSRTEDKVEENLEILRSIIDMMYKVFADRFMFSLISEAYSSPTIVAPVDIPLDFKEPKQLRPILTLTPPASPKSKKTSVSKSGKKGKDKGKGKRKASPTSRKDTGGDEDGDKSGKKGKGKGKGKDNRRTSPSSRKNTEGDEEGDKKSKKGKSKENDKPEKKGKGKEGKGKNKSQSLEDNNLQEGGDENESKNKAKGKGKTEKGKTKKKSKSSDEIEKLQGKKQRVDSSIKIKEKRSSSVKEIKEVKISPEEQLKLFDRPISPEMKLEMKKVEVKDKFILPLSEGVSKNYVENLINSLLPPEIKAKDNENVLKDKSEQKSRKSSSLKKKDKKSLKGDKKAKSKNKKK